MIQQIDERKKPRLMINANNDFPKSSKLITDLNVDCMLELTLHLNRNDTINLALSNSYMARCIGESLLQQFHLKQLLADVRIYVRLKDEFVYDAVRAMLLPRPNYDVDTFFGLYGHIARGISIINEWETDTTRQLNGLLAIARKRSPFLKMLSIRGIVTVDLLALSGRDEEDMIKLFSGITDLRLNNCRMNGWKTFIEKSAMNMTRVALQAVPDAPWRIGPFVMNYPKLEHLELTNGFSSAMFTLHPNIVSLKVSLPQILNGTLTKILTLKNLKSLTLQMDIIDIDFGMLNGLKQLEHFDVVIREAINPIRYFTIFQKLQHHGTLKRFFSRIAEVDIYVFLSLHANAFATLEQLRYTHSLSLDMRPFKNLTELCVEVINGLNPVHDIHSNTPSIHRINDFVLVPKIIGRAFHSVPSLRQVNVIYKTGYRLENQIDLEMECALHFGRTTDILLVAVAARYGCEAIVKVKMYPPHTVFVYPALDHVNDAHLLNVTRIKRERAYEQFRAIKPEKLIKIDYNDIIENFTSYYLERQNHANYKETSGIVLIEQ